MGAATVPAFVRARGHRAFLARCFMDTHGLGRALCGRTVRAGDAARLLFLARQAILQRCRGDGPGDVLRHLASPAADRYAQGTDRSLCRRCDCLVLATFGFRPCRNRRRPGDLGGSDTTTGAELSNPDHRGSRLGNQRGPRRCAGVPEYLPTDREYLDGSWQAGFMPWPPRTAADALWTWEHFTWVFGKFITGLRRTNGGLGYPWSEVFVLLAAAGVLAFWRRQRDTALMLLGPVLVLLLAAALHVYPFTGRVVSFLLPVLLLATAAGTAHLRSTGPSVCNLSPGAAGSGSRFTLVRDSRSASTGTRRALAPDSGGRSGTSPAR